MRRRHDMLCESPCVRLRRKSHSEAEPLQVERAMERVAADDNAETRSALFKALQNTTLVAATPRALTEECSWTAGEGDRIDLVMLASDEGPVLPIFTGVDRLLEYQPDGGGYIALPSGALFEMASASGAVRIHINPGSATQGTIIRRELEALARGRMPLGETEVVAQGTEVRIGRPAQTPPDEVVAAVGQAVASEERAVAAWLFLQQEGANAPELVIGIVLAEGVTGDAEGAAMRAIVEGAGDQSPGAQELLFMRIDQDLQNDLASGAGELIFAR